MAITNKIIWSKGYGEEDYSNKMLCEYEVVCNNPLKVKAVLRWQDSVIAEQSAYVAEQRRLGLSALVPNYEYTHGCAICGKTRVSSHTLKVDKCGNYYFMKSAGQGKYKIYL